MKIGSIVETVGDFEQVRKNDRYLFRGKRVDTGEWVEGFYVFNGHLHLIVGNHRFQGSWDEVYPETVCQFTGLLDKNGARVFDGDIVQSEAWQPSTFKVGFDRGAFYLVDKKGKEGIPEIFGSVDIKYVDKFEVVGNMIDSPELLTTKDSAEAAEKRLQSHTEKAKGNEQNSYYTETMDEIEERLIEQGGYTADPPKTNERPTVVTYMKVEVNAEGDSIRQQPIVPLKLKRLEDGEIFMVKKYINANGEISIWCDEWYGHHKIGVDCVFFDGKEEAQARYDAAVALLDNCGFYASGDYSDVAYQAVKIASGLPIEPE